MALILKNRSGEYFRMDDRDFGLSLYLAKTMVWEPEDADCPDFGDEICDFYAVKGRMSRGDAVAIAEALERSFDELGVEFIRIKNVVEFAIFCRRGEFDIRPTYPCRQHHDRAPQRETAI